MTSRLLLAWLHLIALAIGVGGVWSRARAMRDSLRDPEDARAIRRALIGDAWWGIAAVLWIVTGLWRLLGSVEKDTDYYLANNAFRLKIAFFLGILVLEIWPMMTLMKLRAGKAPLNSRNAGRIEAISYVECALVIAMVLAAVSMARGFGVSVKNAVGCQPSAVGCVPAASVSATPRLKAVTVTPKPLAAPEPPPAADDSDVVVAVEPSGVEVVTNEDLALLAREIAMPLDNVDPAKIKSSFNERRGGGTRAHEALDLMAKRGTPIKSATKGRVLKVFDSKAGGRMVYAADSSERFILLYAHLDSYAPGLKDGARLTQGQVIGYVGSSGNASAKAPHLHFGIARSADVRQWSKGRSIDPLPVLQSATSVARRDVRNAR